MPTPTVYLTARLSRDCVLHSGAGDRSQGSAHFNTSIVVIKVCVLADVLAIEAIIYSDIGN